jgi:hypothetical protein
LKTRPDGESPDGSAQSPNDSAPLPRADEASAASECTDEQSGCHTVTPDDSTISAALERALQNWRGIGDAKALRRALALILADL